MSRRGSLLIVTLWVLAILSVFAIAIARYLSLELRMAKYRIGREQARSLARAGVYLTAVQLTKDAQASGEPYDWVGDDWTPPEVTLPEGRIRVLSVTDEQRRLDLNSARLAQLQAVTNSPEIAQAVLDYVDGEDPAEAMPPYEPKNGPVVMLEELRDIPIMTPEAYEALRRAMTVGAGTTVNVNTVEPEALAAAARTTPEDPVIQAFIAARMGLDGDPGTDDDCIAQNPQSAAVDIATCAGQDDQAFVGLLSNVTLGVTSTVFRIQSQGEVDAPKTTYRVEAIVQRSADGTEPPRILAWREG